MFESQGLILLSGRTPGDTPAQYTFIGPMGRSTIDLVWTNLPGLELIKDSAIHFNSNDTDHLMNIVILKIYKSNSDAGKRTKPFAVIDRYKWKQDGYELFVRSLARSNIINNIEDGNVETLCENLEIAIKVAVVNAGMCKSTSGKQS